MNKKTFTAVACGVLCVGCLAPGVGGSAIPRPPLGFVYGHHHAPVQTNFAETTLGTRKGKASTEFLREPFFTRIPIAAWGDASVEEAARNGRIETVRHVDYEILNVIGVYMRFTVHAYGD